MTRQYPFPCTLVFIFAMFHPGYGIMQFYLYREGLSDHSWACIIYINYHHKSNKVAIDEYFSSRLSIFGTSSMHASIMVDTYCSKQKKKCGVVRACVCVLGLKKILTFQQTATNVENLVVQQLNWNKCLLRKLHWMWQKKILHLPFMSLVVDNHETKKKR